MENPIGDLDKALAPVLLIKIYSVNSKIADMFLRRKKLDFNLVESKGVLNVV